MKNKLIMVIMAFSLSGCAYKGPYRHANTEVNPVVSLYQNYSDKVSGRYALYVDADRMESTIKPYGAVCSAHKFPVDATAQFVTSTHQTFENILESVELVDSPLARSVLNSGAYDGMIVVEVDSFDVDIRAIWGFATYDLDAETEIIVKSFVDDSSGRLFGVTVEGDADAAREGRFLCDGGSEAIGKSVEAAMKEVLQNLAKKVVNSTRLRE